MRTSPIRLAAAAIVAASLGIAALTPAVAASSKKAKAPAPASAAASGPGTFETGGVTIWYEVLGGGPDAPLVLVNGGPGFDHTYFTFSDVWDRLARTRKVVYYDQRGNGKSSVLKEGQPCGLAEQIADLDALRAHLGFEKMNLLGGSWGGYLVMAYAARHPDRIVHLVLVDSAAPKIQDTVFLFKNIFPETVEREDGFAFAAELGDPKAIAADMQIYLGMIIFSPELREKFLARSSAMVYRQAVNKAVWADIQRFDLNPELRRFRFPTLVVTGRYDFNVAPSVAWAIHKAISGSEFAVFEKSGHLPFYEEPDAFLARLEAFLK
jgi:proline iminopeptidase